MFLGGPEPFRSAVGPARPLEEQPGWPAHAAFMDGLVETGVVVLGGPLADGHRVVHAVDAESADVIRGTLSRDPWSGTHARIDTVDVDHPARRATGLTADRDRLFGSLQRTAGRPRGSRESWSPAPMSSTVGASPYPAAEPWEMA